MKRYLFFNIIFPIILVFILPFVIFYFAVQYFSISEINLLFMSLELNENIEIPAYINYLSVAVIIMILFSIIFVAIKKFNSDRVFLSGNIYGTNHYVFYKLAKRLGFKKISLIRKPYYCMFKIVMNGDFDELVDLEEENSKLSSEIQIKVDETKFNNINNLRECNLIVSDTYKIKPNQIPVDKKDFDTIIIARDGHEGVRISSDKLVNEVRKAVIKIIGTGAKINLFLTTSTYNTYKIIRECFMQGERDKIELEVFQQDTKSREKKFGDKGKIVLRRK